MATKIKYDYERARVLPETFQESPPKDCEDELNEECYTALRGSEAARRAGSILSELDKNDIDALYSVLNPVAKKIRWYDSRYNLMQDKIWYLSDENKKLLKRINKMRRRLEELGEKSNY